MSVDKFFNLLMIAYYVISMSQSLPCVIKLIRTKKSNDYSLLNRLLQFIALCILTTCICYNAFYAKTSEVYVGIIGIVDLGVLAFENILVLKYYKWK